MYLYLHLPWNATAIIAFFKNAVETAAATCVTLAYKINRYSDEMAKATSAFV